MAVPYSMVQRKNPLKPNETPKFYAQIRSNGEEDFKAITRAVSDRCTVTGSDAKATLDAFMTIMIQRLRNGKIIRLDDFGSFRISASSEGVEDKKKFNANKIKKARIIFTLCKELKEMCKSASFTTLTRVASNSPDEGDHGEDPTV